jgi:hypothetical protein
MPAVHQQKACRGFGCTHALEECSRAPQGSSSAVLHAAPEFRDGGCVQSAEDEGIALMLLQLLLLCPVGSRPRLGHWSGTAAGTPAS